MFRSLKNFLTKKYDRVEERPFFDFKFKELEDLYRRSLSLGNKGVVQTIAHELSFRTTSSSEELLREVQASIELLNRPTTISLPNDATKLKTSSNSKQSLVDKGNHHSKEKSKFEKFVSFHLLVEDLIRSDKPEVMINSSIWKMLCKSIKNDDKRYTLLSEVAKKIKCNWPYEKSKEEISDYLDISFNDLKTKYGWDQKKVIISAVAMASYAKVKSWRVLNERYGSKTKQEEFYFDDTPAQDENVKPNEEAPQNSVSSNSKLKNGQEEMMSQSEERSNPTSRYEVSTPKSNVDAILNDFDL